MQLDTVWEKQICSRKKVDTNKCGQISGNVDSLIVTEPVPSMEALAQPSQHRFPGPIKPEAKILFLHYVVHKYGAGYGVGRVLGRWLFGTSFCDAIYTPCCVSRSPLSFSLPLENLLSEKTSWFRHKLTWDCQAGALQLLDQEPCIIFRVLQEILALRFHSLVISVVIDCVDVFFSGVLVFVLWFLCVSKQCPTCVCIIMNCICCDDSMTLQCYLQAVLWHRSTCIYTLLWFDLPLTGFFLCFVCSCVVPQDCHPYRFLVILYGVA